MNLKTLDFSAELLGTETAHNSSRNRDFYGISSSYFMFRCKFAIKRWLQWRPVHLLAASAFSSQVPGLDFSTDTVYGKNLI
jgi:hypothetical protein